MTFAVKEAAVERELVARVEALGGICVKICFIGVRGCADRLVALPGGVLRLVEVKRPRGGRLSAHQLQWGREFEAIGSAIATVRNSADIDALLQMKRRAVPGKDTARQGQPALELNPSQRLISKKGPSYEPTS